MAKRSRLAFPHLGLSNEHFCSILNQQNRILAYRRPFNQLAVLKMLTFFLNVCLTSLISFFTVPFSTLELLLTYPLQPLK